MTLDFEAISGAMGIYMFDILRTQRRWLQQYWKKLCVEGMGRGRFRADGAGDEIQLDSYCATLYLKQKAPNAQVKSWCQCHSTHQTTNVRRSSASNDRWSNIRKRHILYPTACPETKVQTDVSHVAIFRVKATRKHLRIVSTVRFEQI